MYSALNKVKLLLKTENCWNSHPNSFINLNYKNFIPKHNHNRIILQFHFIHFRVYFMYRRKLIQLPKKINEIKQQTRCMRFSPHKIWIFSTIVSISSRAKKLNFDITIKIVNFHVWELLRKQISFISSFLTRKFSYSKNLTRKRNVLQCKKISILSNASYSTFDIK